MTTKRRVGLLLAAAVLLVVYAAPTALSWALPATMSTSRPLSATSAKAAADAAQTPSFATSGLAATALWCVAATALAVRAAARRAPQRQGCSRVPRRIIGGVEFPKIFGDWSSPTPTSENEPEVTDGGNPFRESTLNDGITQVSMSFPAGQERFGEEYDRKAGSTDNVYVVEPESGPTVMIGCPSAKFVADFCDMLGEKRLARVQSVVIGNIFDETTQGGLDYLVERHTADKPLQVYCSNVVAVSLKRAYEGKEMSFDVVGIRKNTKLELEDGERVLSFVLAPTPKYPESVITFDPKSGTLFTGKFFSCHTNKFMDGAAPFDAPGREGWEAYSEDWYHLCDCYFFSKEARRAIEKIFTLADSLTGDDVEQIAPRHGPIVKHQCWKLMAKYDAWLLQKLQAESRRACEALVMYASAYGNTKVIADNIAKGLKKSGARLKMMDLEHVTSSEVSDALQGCDGLMIGSPTLGGEMPTQVKAALGIVLGSASSEGTSKLPCGVFGSFGWSGEAVDELYMRLKDGGFQMAFDPIRIRFTPVETDLALCEEAGERMMQKMQKALKDRQRRRVRKVSVTNTGAMVDAFQRMKNSRCVLSAHDQEGADLFVPISWVSQASFDPPAITVALPKKDLDPFLSTSVDKQVESLFRRYDADESGYLDREEVELMIQEVLSATFASEERLNEMTEAAWKTLDVTGDGQVTLDELMKATEGGPLREALDQQRRLAALQETLGGAPQGVGLREIDEKLTFTLNILPEGTAATVARDPEAHPKKKAKNGCIVLKQSHAFIECAITQALDAGDHSILYSQVLGGTVIDDSAVTDMVTTNALQGSHIDVTKGETLAMASSGNRPSSAVSTSRAAFVSGGAAVAPAFGSARRRSMQENVGRRGVATKALGQLSEVETWEGLTPGKTYNLQTMTLHDVAKDTTTIRSLDWDRDRFDIEFALDRGTTYNSYIIKGEQTALVDASHKKFGNLFFEALEKEVDLAKLDYLICSHTEPDHSGLISRVLEKASEAGNDELVVIGSKVCLQFLAELMNRPFKSKVVSNGEKLDLGNGHELEFVIAPNLHWPDTMFTFDHGTNTLYTCDAFGMHYCSDEVYDVEGVEALLSHYALYYDCLMRPNARSVLTALKKTKDMDIQKIAVGHGPILSEYLPEFVEKYRSWSEEAIENLGPSVAIFWVSNFGESERLAQVFAKGVTSCGVLVEMQDLNAVDAFEITEVLARNDILVVLSPPAGGKAEDALDNIVAGVKPKKHRFMVLDSGAEGQEPLDLVRGAFTGAELEEAMPAMKLDPDQQEVQWLQGYQEVGMRLGTSLTKKEKQKKVKGQDKALMRALGRISSSLYVVTACKAGYQHAMIASWLSPASESPLGISLAIAKERAIEPLLRVGDQFNVCFLEDGKSLPLMKHFLQNFAPGQNRLEGVDAFTASNGAPVVRAASGYLQCRVVSRMDASDHWVAYAEVIAGEVQKPEAETATHHRKVATYY